MSVLTAQDNLRIDGMACVFKGRSQVQVVADGEVVGFVDKYRNSRYHVNLYHRGLYMAKSLRELYDYLEDFANDGGDWSVK